MAAAELASLKEQLAGRRIPIPKVTSKRRTTLNPDDPPCRSLAESVRAIRYSLSNLHRRAARQRNTNSSPESRRGGPLAGRCQEQTGTLPPTKRGPQQTARYAEAPPAEGLRNEETENAATRQIVHLKSITALPTGAIQNPQLRQHVFNQGTGHTRGTIDYPKPFAKFSGMAGQLVWEKLMRYAPIEDIARCEKCAKLFIIASVEARAQRRFLEMRERGAGVTLLEIQDDLRRRDERDRSRAVAPLVPAEDAMVIDTSALDRDEAISAAIQAVKQATGAN